MFDIIKHKTACYEVLCVGACLCARVLNMDSAYTNASKYLRISGKTFQKPWLPS